MAKLTTAEYVKKVMDRYGEFIRKPQDVAWYVGRSEDEGLVPNSVRLEVAAQIKQDKFGIDPQADWQTQFKQEMASTTPTLRSTSERAVITGTGAHANCTHPNTKAARNKCRRDRAKGL